MWGWGCRRWAESSLPPGRHNHSASCVKYPMTCPRREHPTTAPLHTHQTDRDRLQQGTGLHARSSAPHSCSPRRFPSRAWASTSAGHLAGRLGPPETARSSQRRRSVHPALRPGPPGHHAVAGYRGHGGCPAALPQGVRPGRIQPRGAPGRRARHLWRHAGPRGARPDAVPRRRRHLDAGRPGSGRSGDHRGPHRPGPCPHKIPRRARRPSFRWRMPCWSTWATGRRALGQPAVASPACGGMLLGKSPVRAAFSAVRGFAKGTLLPARHPRPRRWCTARPACIPPPWSRPATWHRGRDWSGRHRATKRRGTRCGD